MRVNAWMSMESTDLPEHIPTISDVLFVFPLEKKDRGHRLSTSMNRNSTLDRTPSNESIPGKGNPKRFIITILMAIPGNVSQQPPVTKKSN